MAQDTTLKGDIMQFEVPRAEREIKRLRKEAERHRIAARQAQDELSGLLLAMQVDGNRPEGLPSLMQSYTELRRLKSDAWSYRIDREIRITRRDGSEYAVCFPSDRVSRHWYVRQDGIHDFCDTNGGLTSWDEIESISFGAER